MFFCFGTFAQRKKKGKQFYSFGKIGSVFCMCLVLLITDFCMSSWKFCGLWPFFIFDLIWIDRFV